ncbi:MAG: hypothetical protein V4615_07180 [Bacteroidota bacterium]
MSTRIISREEAAKLRLMPFGKKHPVRILIEKLQPGQILHIDRTDFAWKRKTPNFFCRQISKTTKARFEVLKEGKAGWVIERVE